MNCLLVVDYRFNIDEKDLLIKILKSTVILAKKLKMDATVTACSLPDCYKILQRKWFFKFGDKDEIITNYQLTTDPYKSSMNRVFATFADSDSDFYFGH